ncbi:hypothetical protein [Terrabacter sp. NPDC080008]|uniref:hypothetical protein n=1 Tax=Terrabacter sp. NPDC080008 TaxID=3155176 RepID=UPI00344C1381
MAVLVLALTVCVQLAVGHFDPIVSLLSASVVLVLPQDVLRWAAIADQKLRDCLISDLIWAVVSLAMLFTPAIASSAAACVAVWTMGAGLALLWLLLRTGVAPTFAGLREWWMRGRTVRLFFGLEGIVSSWTGFVSLSIATVTVGTAGSAAMRGGGLLLGPLALVLSAIPMLGIPELARSGQVKSGRDAWQRLRIVAWTLALLSLLVGSVALVLPQSLGFVVLGDTWDGTKRIVWIVAIEYAGLGFLHCASAGLKALGLARMVFLVRAAYACSCFIFVAVSGVVFRSAAGASSALALCGVVFAVIVVQLLVRGNMLERVRIES